jgi:hypothetical protein
VRLSEQQPAGQPDEHDADLAGRSTTATGPSCSANRMKMSASGESEQGGFDEVPGRVGDRPGEDQPGDQQSGRPLRSRDEVDELFDAPE